MRAVTRNIPFHWSGLMLNTVEREIFARRKFTKSIAAKTVLFFSFRHLFSLDLFSHTPKFFPGRISTLCKRCVDALRRWQATSMHGERVWDSSIWRRIWPRVMATFACSIAVGAAMTKRPNRIWELCIIRRKNRHEVLQSHDSKSNFFFPRQRWQNTCKVFAS